jgi:hypothetical protein
VSVSGWEAALERWKLARRSALGDPATEADLFGFFQAFRPEGSSIR